MTPTATENHFFTETLQVGETDDEGENNMNIREQILSFPKLEQINSTYGRRYYRLPNNDLAVSVTTALKTLNKENLIFWAANTERTAAKLAAEAAFTELTTGRMRPTLAEFQHLMDVKLGAEKAHQRISEAARNIGVDAHRLIEYRLRKRLGEAVGDEPRVGDASMIAVLKFESWAKSVGFEVIAVEFQAWNETQHFAGTADFLARLGDGKLYLGDWKVSSGLYIESNLQSAAYRKGLAGLLGMKEPLGGLVVRLPKDIDKPEIEVKTLAPENLEKDFTGFRACLWLWKYLNNFDPKQEVPAPRAARAPASPVPKTAAARWAPKQPSVPPEPRPVKPWVPRKSPARPPVPADR